MPWVHKIHELSIKRQGLLSLTVALGLFTVSVALRFLFEPVLEGAKFLTFWPAIALATLICGWRQGVFVLVLSALTGWYYFMEPLNSFAIKDKTTTGALGGFLIVGGFIIILVAALREAIRRVELANAAKDILFGELQHRVANNLQLVVALLRNAQRNLRNPVLAAETLTDAEERIMAMSQLHRRLNDGTAFIYGLNTLLREMLSNAFRDLPVSFRVDVGDMPDLSIDQMTAIALLVNEAALNAAKHVFSKGLGTRFDVSLSKDESGHLHLMIKDNGPGMSAEVMDAQARSLGMGIMESFAKQLGGPLEIRQGAGTSLSVEFTIP
jgi:two-component system, sensor histidine kinase PdtaS